MARLHRLAGARVAAIAELLGDHLVGGPGLAQLKRGALAIEGLEAARQAVHRVSLPSS